MCDHEINKACFHVISNMHVIVQELFKKSFEYKLEKKKIDFKKVNINFTL